jgi:prephenate dehydrogenase
LLPVAPAKLIASLVASGGVNSARLKTVEVPSVTLVFSTPVPASEIALPCTVPLAVAGLPLTDVQSAKSDPVSAEAKAGRLPMANSASARMSVARRR